MKKLMQIAVVALVGAALCFTASATTYTNTNLKATYSPQSSPDNPVVAVAILDFSEIPVVVGDVVNIMGIPAGAAVGPIMYQMTTTNTPTGGTNTCDIGVTGTATKYKSNVDMTSTSPLLGTAAAQVETANIYMTVTADDTFTNGVLKVWCQITKRPPTPAAQGVTP